MLWEWLRNGVQPPGSPGAARPTPQRSQAERGSASSSAQPAAQSVPGPAEPGGSACWLLECLRNAVRPPGSRKASLGGGWVGMLAIGNRYGTQCSHSAQKNSQLAAPEAASVPAGQGLHSVAFPASTSADARPAAHGLQRPTRVGVSARLSQIAAPPSGWDQCDAIAGGYSTRVENKRIITARAARRPVHRPGPGPAAAAVGRLCDHSMSAYSCSGDSP